jgi:ubiquinone/menaquinone biosynthesis C-methylase UbiE
MSKKKTIRDSYDKISEEYNKKSDRRNSEIENKFLSKLSDEDIILDAGCGGNPFTSNKITTVGLDISRVQLKKATNCHSLIQGDIENLPFNSNEFDGLVAYHSVIHIPLEKHKDIFKEFYRILKKDSYAIITENKNKWCGKNDNWLNSNQKMFWEMAGEEKTHKQLEKVGFNIKNIYYIEDNLSENSSKKPYFLIKK